jgi:hypothetical protein
MGPVNAAQAVNAVGNVIEDPGGFKDAVVSSVKETVDKGMNGTPREQGEVVGAVLGAVAEAAIGTKGAAKLLGATGKATGQAAKTGVQANRAAGNAFRDEIAGLLQKEGREVATEVYKKTPFGKRFIDIEVSHGGKVLGGIETKVGGSRYLPAQRAKDAWLNLTGYPVNVVRKP